MLQANAQVSDGQDVGRAGDARGDEAVIEGYCQIRASAGLPKELLDGMRPYLTDELTAEFARAEMRDAPAKLVVEIQFMTKEYYAMRKKTHAWYKVVRADHANGMLVDYAGGL